MLRKVLFSKIHHAVVTQVRPDYSGSLTIDESLLHASGLRNSDAILVANCTTGARFETYVFAGAKDSGIIGINGAAAHCASTGDKIIIIHWAQLTDAEYAQHHPKILIMNSDNTIKESLNYHPSTFELSAPVA